MLMDLLLRAEPKPNTPTEIVEVDMRKGNQEVT